MNIDSALSKIRTFFKTNKRIPSYQEMCSLFGFASKKASFDLAKKLIAAGFLEKDETGRLIPKKLFPLLPILGVIRAGIPSAAESELYETMSFDNYLVTKPDKSYLLRVTGDSMIDAGIFPDDIVVVEKGKEPRNGDIVVAHIDNEFTLKYFYKKNKLVTLVPANKKYSSITPKEELTVFGIVISVMRRYH